MPERKEMKPKRYYVDLDAAIGEIDDLCVQRECIDKERIELQEEVDELSCLVVDLWYALKETSQVASDYFKAKNPKIKRYI